MSTSWFNMRLFCSWIMRYYPAVIPWTVTGYHLATPTYSMLSFFFFCSSRSLSCHIDIFPFTPGLSDPQVGPRHQPSERSDGWHEGSGGGGGQGRQHRPGTPQGPGESRTVTTGFTHEDEFTRHKESTRENIWEMLYKESENVITLMISVISGWPLDYKSLTERLLRIWKVEFERCWPVVLELDPYYRFWPSFFLKSPNITLIVLNCTHVPISAHHYNRLLIGCFVYGLHFYI